MVLWLCGAIVGANAKAPHLTRATLLHFADQLSQRSTVNATVNALGATVAADPLRHRNIARLTKGDVVLGAVGAVQNPPGELTILVAHNGRVGFAVTIKVSRGGGVAGNAPGSALLGAVAALVLRVGRRHTGCVEK